MLEICHLQLRLSSHFPEHKGCGNLCLLTLLFGDFWSYFTQILLSAWVLQLLLISSALGDLTLHLAHSSAKNTACLNWHLTFLLHLWKIMRTLAPWHISLEQESRYYHAVTHLRPPALSPVSLALPFSPLHSPQEPQPSLASSSLPWPRSCALSHSAERPLCRSPPRRDVWGAISGNTAPAWFFSEPPLATYSSYPSIKF